MYEGALLILKQLASEVSGEDFLHRFLLIRGRAASPDVVRPPTAFSR